jgi:predicted nucleic acid-binding protein
MAGIDGLGIENHNVMGLVKDSDCSAYDCEFVALVRRLGAPFVTMDGKLLRAFPKVARALDVG